MRFIARSHCLLLLLAVVLSPGADAAGWLTSTHPCPGANRTDALHRDDDGTLWVGCGSNATGYGLFLSDDGGASWRAAPTSPVGALATFRVSSITRGQGGALYIAGFDASTATMALRLSTAATPFATTAWLSGVAQVGRQFHVGTYRELADGRGVAESLNGYDLLYFTPGVSSASASTWTTYTPARQILDLVVFDDRFWGAGSTIFEPPTLFLPPTDSGAEPYMFEIAEPATATGFEGELWGLAVNDARLVGIGVDQDDDRGKIFVSGANKRTMSGYTEFSLSAILGSPAARSWARGVCMRDQQIAVVGERQPLGAGTGVVVYSEDGGNSFRPITPPGVTSTVSRCVIEPDGTLVVAGAAGFVGILPADPQLFASGFETP